MQQFPVVASNDQADGSWAGKAASAFDPKRNRAELIRFAAILLADEGISSVSGGDILGCIERELGVFVQDNERVEILKILETHSSLVRRANDLFEIR